nr:MAG TPA: Helix-turn-helix XRE-family like protein [Bacteriophage sp.]
MFIYGYNQATLANKIGVTRATISSICRGYKRPSITTSKKIAEALEMDDRDLRRMLLEEKSTRAGQKKNRGV